MNLPTILHNSKLNPDTGCLEWQGSRTDRGYPRTKVGGRRGKTILLHREVYRLTFGEFDSKLSVCHSCDNPPCVNSNHLFLGTHQDNIIDRDRKHRQARLYGTARPYAVLNDEAVKVFKFLHARGVPVVKLAKVYKLPYNTIYNVISGQTWLQVKV